MSPLDDLLPSAQPPAPALQSVGERSVLVARLAAAVIDILVCYVLLELPAIYALSVVFPGEYEALGPAAVLLSVFFLLPLWSTYSFAFEWCFARTPGKVNRGLMVVTDGGRPCTLRASAVRNIARYVDAVGVPPLVVGTVLPLVTDGRRVGDLLADTDVVRVEAPESEPIVSPEERERWEQAVEASNVERDQ